MKICTKCKRELPENSDFYFTKYGKFNNRCKECCGKHFTNKLSQPNSKDGYIFCKKCTRELPHTKQYFPIDKNCKNGLRNVCRECNKKYGRFLNDNEEYNFQHWSDEENKLIRENYSKYTGLELKELFFP